MSVNELQSQVLALTEDEQKEFILNLLPEIAPTLGSDQAFLMRLFPVMMALVKESGIDIQQLVQMAAMFSSAQNQEG